MSDDSDDALLPLFGDDDFDEEPLFAARDEAYAAAAAVVREALASRRGLPPPPDIDAVGGRARTRVAAGSPTLDWVRRSAGLDRDLTLSPGNALAGEDVLWELTAASIEIPEDPGLDPEQQASLMLLEPADWIGAIIGAVRAGPGSPADPATLVRHIDRCPEVEGPPMDPDDAELLERAFELRLPAWEALGLVDGDRRLTEIGAWLLPRALCTALDSDFDHPEDDLGEDEHLLDGDDPFAPDGLEDNADADDMPSEVSQLASDFAAWCRNNGVTADDEWVATLLDLRFTYLDDELVSWRQDDLRELLLEVCPRKLSVESSEMREALAAFATFLEFLADIGLDEDSEPVETLTAWLRHATDTVVAAQDDPSKWGPAKALGAALEADGIDITDRDAVNAWMAEFNERPIEERDALLGRMGPASDLPPQIVPSDEALAELVGATKLMQEVTGLVTYVGDRLALTDAGNLKLADARTLVKQLDTGDVIDPTMPWGATQKTRSSTELTALTRTFELAQAVGLLEHDGRRIRPRADKIARLREAPTDVWEELVVAWLRFGFLTTIYGGQPPVWAQQIDGLVIDLLMALSQAEGPLPLDALGEMFAEEPPYPFDADDDRFAALMRDAVHRWALQLQTAGLVAVQGMRTTTDRHGRTSRHGGTVVQTPLVPLLLSRVAGASVHQQGALRTADAATLLDAAIAFPLELAQTEVELWVSDRDPSAAATEIAASLPGPGRERILGAMLVFDLIGAPARPAVESLQTDPVAGTFARAWLVQHGYLDLDPNQEGEAALDTMIGVLATLAEIGPDAIVGAIEQLGEPSEQIAFVERAWRSSIPEATAILEAIGDLHPDKAVRKAARKAAFKRRSATK